MELVKVRSIQIIKPSNPTPENRRYYKLSLLDQLAPSENIPIVFYYKASSDVINMTNKCSQLVKSLSEALTLFYPLAGRITEDGVEVNCSDQGVKYLETQVSTTLDDFLEQGPKIALISELISLADTTLVAVQVNVFDCGALVIGVSGSHRVTDACNLVRFVNEWASISRTGVANGSFSPSFDNLVSLFPPKKFSPSSDLSTTLDNTQAKMIHKRFVFNRDNISKLRAKASSSPNHRFSRVTLVAAIIWKAIISMDQTKIGILRNCLLAPAISLRGKVGSPISESSFGNIWFPYPIRFLHNSMESEFVDLVGLIEGTTRNFITRLAKASGEEMITQAEACYTEVYEEIKNDKFAILTSWCRFRTYEADFGWGKPCWLSTAGYSYEIVTLMDDKDGDGIEAWVSLKEENMYLFEKDQDIIAFTS